MPTSSTPEKDLYEVLQVHPNASQAMIRKAFGWLAKEYHPDKNPERREWAETRMKALNEAFETLSDPAKRRTYDQSYSGPSLANGARRKGGGRAHWDAPPGTAADFDPTRRDPEERQARRSKYYTSHEEAYASDGAPAGSAAYERQRAQDYVERKRYDRAIRHFRRALNLDPDDATLMVELGMAYYLSLNLIAAREWLDRALGLNPSIADAHYMLGMISLDETVLQAVERDASGGAAYKGRSQRRYFTLLGRAVEHFEKALYLAPMMFKKQFTFFPTRKSISEYAGADVTRVKSVYDFAREAQHQHPLKQALIDWYFDHAQNAFNNGSGPDGEFGANVRRLMPKAGSQMFFNSWAYAALKRGLELYPEDMTLLRSMEKLLANAQFLGEQPMSKELQAEMRRLRSDIFIRIRTKDPGFAPSPTEISSHDGLTLALVAFGMLMVVWLVWQLTRSFTELF